MRVLFGLYVSLVVVVSLVPGDGRSFWHLDKVGHFLAYFGMVVLGGFTFRTRSLLWRTALFAIVLGIALEGIQFFVAGRDMSWLDGVTNGVGVFFGVGFYQKYGAALIIRWHNLINTAKKYLIADK